jgi:hypothetical protein
MAKVEFPNTRRAIVTVASIVGIATLAGLVVLDGYRDEWPLWIFSAGTSLLAVIFGLAVVSFVWELFVRQSHSTDLRHYLRLGASVAQSGLQEATTFSRLNWPELLSNASEITVLTDSAEWLGAHQYSLRDHARERVLTVRVAVPASKGTFLQRYAELRGLQADKLSEDIEDIAERSTKLWREAGTGGKPVRAGSKLSVIEHDLDVNYEVFTIDRKTIVTFRAPGDYTGQHDRLAFVYEQSAEQYPTDFLRTYMANLDGWTKLREWVP